MSTLSACLIVKNESEVIGRCLDSLYDAVDEIIIYDTGSNDGTQDICKSYSKVKLIQGYWNMDFARARNESFKHATSDYLMWADADDVLEDFTVDWIKKAKENDFDGYDNIMMNYVYSTDESGNPLRYSFRERIVKASNNPKWVGEIHEVIITNGNILYVPIDKARFLHKPHAKPNPKRNFEIFQNMEKKNHGKLSTRDWFYYARETETHDTIENAIKRYKKAIERDDMWNIDRLNAYISLSKIYETRNKRKAYEYAIMAAPLTSTPRADVCCRIGDLYLSDKNYKMAKIWYDLALDNEPEKTENTFFDRQYATTYPMLQLCVVEYWLGNVEKSIEYNEKYGKIKPESSAYLYNKEFFSKLNNQ